MGKYLNPRCGQYEGLLADETFVDKTGLLEYTNGKIGKSRRFIASSRPRRFGKSMAAQMLCMYYCKAYDSRATFEKLKIGKSPTFEEQLNKWDVLFMDIRELMRTAEVAGDPKFLGYINQIVTAELREAYPEAVADGERDMANALADINTKTGARFVIIIDEWDCFFRERKEDTDLQKNYISLLYNLFKSPTAGNFTALAYITGILPIKKYNVESKLNNFTELTMIDPDPIGEYVGFTDSDVRLLCERFGMDYEEMHRWYDGYSFTDVPHVYCPNSVVSAIDKKRCRSYWTQTESFESLRMPINLNLDGLKDEIALLLEGEQRAVDTGTFQNDMTTFESKDDALTLLIHLGYLAYDADTGLARIPNQEIRDEFKRAIVSSKGWGYVSEALIRSDELLSATLAMDGEKVARILREVHRDNTSIFAYNDENALACVVTLGFYSACKSYIQIREMPAGEGRADIIFIPRRNATTPALVIELKWDRSATGAIKQIKDRQYPEAMKDYAGEILLVGIDYDKDTKEHECVIEKWAK